MRCGSAASCALRDRDAGDEAAQRVFERLAAELARGRAS
jgi:hypothetical protein